MNPDQMKSIPVTHINDDELTLHYYKDPEAPAGVTTHLESCEECSKRFQTIALVLNSIAPESDAESVPEPDGSFETRLLAKMIEPPAAPRLGTFRSRPLVWGSASFAALAATLIVGFSIGRDRGLQEERAAMARSKERVVLSAVSSHLERSRMTLVELRNTEASAEELAELQAAAGEVVRASRLFRAAAAKVGDAPVLAVMEETERLLLRFVNAAPTEAASELNTLKKRVESKDLLFRLRVMESQVEKKEKDLAPAIL